jgi:hypothetical protein
MPKKYNPDKDTVETTFTIDHDLKVIHCWSNHKSTIRQWLRDYPDEIMVGTGGGVFLNGIPLPITRRIKVVPKKKRIKTIQ